MPSMDLTETAVPLVAGADVVEVLPPPLLPHAASTSVAATAAPDARSRFMRNPSWFVYALQEERRRGAPHLPPRTRGWRRSPSGRSPAPGSRTAACAR